jgi:hypothetical protein
MIFMHLLCEKTNNYIYLLAIFRTIAINKKKKKLWQEKRCQKKKNSQKEQ